MMVKKANPNPYIFHFFKFNFKFEPGPVAVVRAPPSHDPQAADAQRLGLLKAQARAGLPDSGLAGQTQPGVPSN